MDGAADVAQTTYTPFRTEPGAAPVRLIVRRVKPTPGSQLALFATYSYHGFITDRDGETLELEADHRRHAEIENAIRDLKYGVGLNHMPSGRFAANGAWLAVQVMAHNLARWTARIGLGEQIATTKTLRRRFFSLAGRLTRSARRLTLHLPQRWPWETQSVAPWHGCERFHSQPDGARPQLTRHPPNRTSPQTRASPLREHLSPRPLPAISPYPTSPDGHKVSPRRLKTDTGPIYPNRARTIASLCPSSPILLLQRHTFGGFGLIPRNRGKPHGTGYFLCTASVGIGSARVSIDKPASEAAIR